MAESTSERRRNARVPVHVEATIRMLLPEETFTPLPMRGFTKDISASGLRFETTETTEDYYRLIIRKIRYARLTTVLPGTDEELTLLGRVVWVQFNNKLTPPLATFGLSFEELGATEQTAVKRCVDLVLKGTPGAGERPDSPVPDVEIRVENGDSE